MSQNSHETITSEAAVAGLSQWDGSRFCFEKSTGKCIMGATCQQHKGVQIPSEWNDVSMEQLLLFKQMETKRDRALVQSVSASYFSKRNISPY